MYKVNSKSIKSSNERCLNYRKKILELSQKVGALHIGGSFSSVEILDVIYNFLIKKGDKFILSKGHTGILQYVVLNHKKIIPKKLLHSYCQKNSKLGVHPDYGLPGIEASTGSLGHGLGIASGLAISKLKNKIFVVISDGELMEGTTWEYILMISSLKISNINLFIDANGLQSSTFSKDTHPTLMPITDKLKSFGWSVGECNGHKVSDILKNHYKSIKSSKPFALVCNTTKGYPIPYMMNVPMWHYRSPNKQEYIDAVEYLNKFYNGK